LNGVLKRVCEIAAENDIMIICPMDKYQDGNWLNVAYVISEKGEVLGCQTKNQLDPSEDSYWMPGTERKLFECGGISFGITICHEGFRYPESVRWAAQKGAKIIFHPHFTYTENRTPLTEWGHHQNPYYEKAMMLRAMENTIYYAGSNFASEFSDAASSIISPDGTYIAHEKYGKAGVTVADIDLDRATGLLAKRFNGKQYESN
jgi:predicted amidohydrolase